MVQYGTESTDQTGRHVGVAAAVHLAQPTTHPQQVLPLRELEDAHQCRVSLHKQGHNLQVAF